MFRDPWRVWRRCHFLGSCQIWLVLEVTPLERVLFSFKYYFFVFLDVDASLCSTPVSQSVSQSVSQWVCHNVSMSSILDGFVFATINSKKAATESMNSRKLTSHCGKTVLSRVWVKFWNCSSPETWHRVSSGGVLEEVYFLWWAAPRWGYPTCWQPCDTTIYYTPSKATDQTLIGLKL